MIERKKTFGNYYILVDRLREIFKIDIDIHIKKDGQGPKNKRVRKI